MAITGKRKSFARAGKGAVDRPFAPGILRRAREIVDGYQMIVRVEDGEFIGRGTLVASERVVIVLVYHGIHWRVYHRSAI